MTKTKPMQARELEGDALDYAVAIALGYQIETTADVCGFTRWRTPENCTLEYVFEPSRDSHHSLAIITRYNIDLSPPTAPMHVYGGPRSGWTQSGTWSATTWEKGITGKRALAWHQTAPLVAAMRCFVIFKLGDVVDIPEDLLP